MSRKDALTLIELIFFLVFIFSRDFSFRECHTLGAEEKQIIFPRECLHGVVQKLIQINFIFFLNR